MKVVIALGVAAASAACTAEDPSTATAVQSTNPQDRAGLARYDFSCRGQALPATAPASLTVTGFTNDSYSGGVLPDVTVDLMSATDDHVLATTWSTADGELAFQLATADAPLYAYARMQADGHVTSYLYPGRPLASDQHAVFFPVLSPAWREELAADAGVTLDPTKGIVGVIVTDCEGKRVEGATVTFDPPAQAVAYWDPTFTDGSGPTTSINGHAWGFNVPAGVVHATVTIGDVIYRDWPVESFADGRTLSWRAP